MERTEVDRKELLTYYDQFYLRDDFRYYSESVTKRFFEGVLSKCRIRPPGTILDVGCGTGYYCKIFHDLGFRPVGIDFSKSAIEKAKEKYPHLEFQVADALNLPFKPSTFDVILSYGCSVVSTYDLSAIQDYIRHLTTYLKPRGWLLLIGGSNLSGSRLSPSTWLAHSWKDLLRFLPEGNLGMLGPYLSHVRLIALLGKWGLNSPITLLLHYLPMNLVRTTFHLVRKSGPQSHS
jgi:SAM-dependent methyltransferase